MIFTTLFRHTALNTILDHPTTDARIEALVRSIQSTQGVILHPRRHQEGALLPNHRIIPALTVLTQEAQMGRGMVSATWAMDPRHANQGRRELLTEHAFHMAHTYKTISKSPSFWQMLQLWFEHHACTGTDSEQYERFTLSSSRLEAVEPLLHSVEAWQAACLQIHPPLYITRALLSLMGLDPSHILDHFAHTSSLSNEINTLVEIARARLMTMTQFLIHTINALSTEHLYPLESASILLVIAARHATQNHPLPVHCQAFETGAAGMEINAMVTRCHDSFSQLWLMSWGTPLGLIKSYGLTSVRKAWSPLAFSSVLVPELTDTHAPPHLVD